MALRYESRHEGKLVFQRGSGALWSGSVEIH